jgi:hypothetical protein
MYCRASIALVPRPSTTSASVWPPNSKTNADCPRDASCAAPPCAASIGDVAKAFSSANRLAASSTS